MDLPTTRGSTCASPAVSPRREDRRLGRDALHQAGQEFDHADPVSSALPACSSASASPLVGVQEQPRKTGTVLTDVVPVQPKWGRWLPAPPTLPGLGVIFDREDSKGASYADGDASTSAAAGWVGDKLVTQGRSASSGSAGYPEKPLRSLQPGRGIGRPCAAGGGNDFGWRLGSIAGVNTIYKGKLVLENSELDSRYQALVSKFRACEYRITPQRLAILRLLAKSTDHPSAGRIYRSSTIDFPPPQAWQRFTDAGCAPRNG